MQDSNQSKIKIWYIAGEPERSELVDICDDHNMSEKKSNQSFNMIYKYVPMELMIQNILLTQG